MVPNSIHRVKTVMKISPWSLNLLIVNTFILNVVLWVGLVFIINIVKVGSVVFKRVITKC